MISNICQIRLEDKRITAQKKIRKNKSLSDTENVAISVTTEVNTEFLHLSKVYERARRIALPIINSV